MQHFQGQAQGQVELLCLPTPFNLFFSLSTSRTQTQFVSQETLPQNFCGILILRQQLGFRTRNGPSQNLSEAWFRQVFGSLELNFFVFQNRPEISWQPHLSLEIPCPASLSPQMDICTSLALTCTAGTPRKLKQDQSSLVLKVV